MMSTQNPARPTLHREAAMLAKGKARILSSGDWLTAPHILKLTQLDRAAFDAQLNAWKHERKIFSLSNEGVEYLPIYAFDPSAGYRLQPSLAEVIVILAPRKNSWGMAFWFGSSNSYLGGRMPKDVFQNDLQRVLDAAKCEICDAL